MKKIFLSPSTINLHEDCPRCFYLHIKYEIKRPRGPMPSIAIGIDSVVKKYFDYYRKISELPPILKNDMEGRLVYALKPTYFSDIKRGYCLLGKLDDCLVSPDGTHSPLDHKTRANPTPNVHPTYQLQMELYSVLLKNNGLPVNDRAYLIYYCPEKMVPEPEEQKIDFIIDIKQIKLDLQHAQEAINNAITCLEQVDIPESSEKCEFCKWVKDAGTPPVENILFRKENVSTPSAEEIKKEEPEEEYKDSLF
ncbi:PD-(D/E)XK nuclease family protein [bacterium]|nr:PD-(D/E)XK nuclease family protein [bacterium]